MFTSEFMKRVHEIARELEGDYSARLVLAFKAISEETEVHEIKIAYDYLQEVKANSDKKMPVMRAKKAFEATYKAFGYWFEQKGSERVLAKKVEGKVFIFNLETGKEEIYA